MNASAQYIVTAGNYTWLGMSTELHGYFFSLCYHVKYFEI